MITNTASTAELADARPISGGEYFYHEGAISFICSCVHGLPTCFVCGKKANTAFNYRAIEAIAQCVAAGKRVVAMFKEAGACQTGEHRNGGASVTINVCEEHKRHAEILCRLTGDGIITAERVSRAEKALISRFEFNKLVSKEAREIWGGKEQPRRHINWCDAWPLCLKEFGRVPSLAERKNLAERLWQERKEAQALEDWLQAEKKILALYTPDA